MHYFIQKNKKKTRNSKTVEGELWCGEGPPLYWLKSDQNKNRCLKLTNNFFCRQLSTPLLVAAHLSLLFRLNELNWRRKKKENRSEQEYSTVSRTVHDEAEVGANRCLLSYSLKPQGADIFLRKASQQQPAKKPQRKMNASVVHSVWPVFGNCKCHLLVSSRVGGSASPRSSNSTALWPQGGALFTCSWSHRVDKNIYSPQVFILAESRTSVRKTGDIPEDSYTDFLQERTKKYKSKTSMITVYSPHRNSPWDVDSVI